MLKITYDMFCRQVMEIMLLRGLGGWITDNENVHIVTKLKLSCLVRHHAYLLDVSCCTVLLPCVFSERTQAQAFPPALQRYLRVDDERRHPARRVSSRLQVNCYVDYNCGLISH
jgi:hypothetical protein